MRRLIFSNWDAVTGLSYSTYLISRYALIQYKLIYVFVTLINTCITTSYRPPVEMTFPNYSRKIIDIIVCTFAKNRILQLRRVHVKSDIERPNTPDRSIALLQLPFPCRPTTKKRLISIDWVEKSISAPSPRHSRASER